MDQTGFVHRREGAAQVYPDECGLTGTKGSPLLQLVLQRAAGEQLHPDPNDAVNEVGTVDRDDVLVAQLGEQPAFRNHRRERSPLTRFRPKQFQGDVSIQTRIASEIDGAERPGAEPGADLERPPALHAGVAERNIARLRRRFHERVEGVRATVHLRKAREDS